MIQTKRPIKTSSMTNSRRSPKTNTFNIGDSVTYTCPWTGYIENGVIVDPAGESDYGCFDIQNEDGSIDIQIPCEDILEVA